MLALVRTERTTPELSDSPAIAFASARSASLSASEALAFFSSSEQTVVRPFTIRLADAPFIE